MTTEREWLKQPGPATTSGPSRWAFLLGAPRDALYLRILLPVWLWWLLLAAVDGWRGAEGGAAWMTAASRALLPTLAAAGVVPLAGWVAVFSVRLLVTDEVPLLGELHRGVRRGLGTLLFAVLVTILTPAFFLAVALCGAVLGRVPWVGGILSGLWVWTVGLLLCGLAAGWILMGVPALLLVIPASVTEFPQGFEITSRCFGYVRTRPGYVLGGLARVLGAAALGSLAFLLLLSLVLIFLAGLLQVRAGSLPDPVAAARSVAAVWMHPGAWWPLGCWEPGACPLARALPEPSRWLLAAGMLVPAFFVTSVFAGLARLYLLVRREVDRTPVGELYELYRG